MNKDTKFILKAFGLILIIIAIIFIIQVGKNYSDIKSGKMDLTKYNNDSQFTKSSNDTGEESKLDTKTILNDNAPFFGSDNPELTIVEFGSFSCPYSKQEAPIARELMLKYQDKVKFIYRDFPLDDIYPNASSLGLAGRCANEQNGFWRFHDRMFSGQVQNSYATAIQAGLNDSIFLGCVKQEKYFDDLQKDLNDGLANGVKGTPTFFFIKKGHENSPQKLEGAIPANIFEEIISKLLGE